MIVHNVWVCYTKNGQIDRWQVFERNSLEDAENLKKQLLIVSNNKLFVDIELWVFKPYVNIGA